MVGLPSDAVKLVIQGSIAGVQSWSVGLWGQITLPGGAWAIANQQAATEDLAGFVETWAVAMRQFWAPDTQYEQLSSYFYPAHSLVSTQVGTFAETTPIVGTGSHYHSTSCSMVQSLRTDVPGRSGRGRIYVPADAANINTAHEFSSSDIGAASGATATMLHGFNGYSSVPHGVTALHMMVASFTKLQMNDITSVVVDSRPDSQRRREDKMPITNTSTSPVT